MKRLIALILLLLSGCASEPPQPSSQPVSEPVSTPAPEPAPAAAAAEMTPAASTSVPTAVTSPPEPAEEPTADRPVAPLGWERGHPERQDWSHWTYTLIRHEQFANYDSASDATRFCSRYPELSEDQKATVWAEMIAGIAFYESRWNPTSQLNEAYLGMDAVTRQTMRAEGLLQLAYQDIKWAPYCDFDWQSDRKLAQNDPARSILDPERNLVCGIRIMGRQIRRHGRVIASSRVYWTVLKDSSRYQKISEITDMTQSLPFCRAH